MNFATLWQRRLSLLAAAFCAAATANPALGCDVVVTGGQPVIVNIYLDPITGLSSLSGTNIAAFVQGTGPGCNEYQFYYSADKTTYIGNQVDFSCIDVNPNPQFFVVRMDNFDGDPDNGNESNAVLLSVIVHDNTVPTVSCPSNKTYTTIDDGDDNCLFRAEDGVTVASGDLELTWADNCGAPQYNFNNGPWTNGQNLASPFHNFPLGVTTVRYRVQDGTHTASCSFTVTVNDISPPILNNIPDPDTVPGDVPFGQILAFYVNNLSGATAHDSCDGPRPIVYSAIADTLDNCPFTHEILRTWLTTDLAGNVNSATQLITVIDTFAPVVAPYPSDTTIFTTIDDIFCDAYFEIDPLSFAVDCSPLDSLTVEYWVNGSPVTSVDGYYVVGSTNLIEFIVADQCGNADTTTFNLWVGDLTPPTASCVGTVNLSLNNAGFVNVSAHPEIFNQSSYDNCTASANLYFFADPSYFDCSMVGIPQTVTLYVYDDYFNSATCTSTVNVQDNTDPVLICPADATFNCAIDETIAGYPTASDACGVAGITVSESQYNQTGPHCFEAIRTYTATDVNGNEGFCYQYLVVQDNYAPTLLGVPADTIVACGTILDDPTVIAFDTCDGEHIVVPTIQFFPGGNCAVDHIKSFQVRTWEATDSCGNYAITQDTIKFLDYVAPDISAVPTDLTFYVDPTDCDGLIDIDLSDYDIFDACGNGPVTISPSTWVATQPAGDYVFPYSVVDECDNIVFGEINVHVVDNSIPTVVCQTEINVSLDSTGFHLFDVNELLINATDNCDNNLDFTLSQDYATCADASLEALGFGAVIVTVTATDDHGNSNSCPVIVHTIAPPGIGILIDNYTFTDPSYSGANDGSVEIISVAGGSGNFDYGVFDGFSGDLISPTAFNDTLTAGLYILGAQDLQTSCIDAVFVSLNDGPLPVIIADTISGPHGDTLCVAVTVDNFQNIVSAQMDISVPDASVAQVIGVENWQPADFTLAVTNPLTNDFTVSMMNPSTQQVDLVDGDTLFCIWVELTGSLFDTTSVTIIDGTVELVSGSTGNFFSIPADNQDGFVAVNSGQADANIEGEIIAWWGAPVAQADVYLNGGQDIYTTGNDGKYGFQVPIGDPCELTPYKDINYPNGVSVFDLFTIQRHILGDPAALGSDPYKIIAADANADDIVTTFDLVELQYIILNPIGADISTNTSWRFVPTDWQFASPSNPWSPQFPESIDLGIVLADSLQNDFVGIKVGDVDGDADPLNLTSSDDRSPMLFELNDRPVEAGETVALPVLARGFDGRLGWQMTLDFDPQLFDYQGVVAGSLPNVSENNFGEASIAEGKLTTAWFSTSPVSLRDGEVLFTLLFKAKKAATAIEQSLKISSEITPAIGIGPARSAQQPQIVWSRAGQKPAASLPFELAQNRPNPFTDETLINFTLPEAAEATFNIFDATGKLVKTSTASYAKGLNQIRLGRSELSGTGVYFYEIKTATASARKRMVLVD